MRRSGAVRRSHPGGVQVIDYPTYTIKTLDDLRAVPPHRIPALLRQIEAALESLRQVNDAVPVRLDEFVWTDDGCDDHTIEIAGVFK
jgi:hypothetical protein